MTISEHGTPNANLPASDLDVVSILAQAASEQEKVDAAAVVLADAKTSLSAADAVFAEAKARFEEARRAFSTAEDVHRNLTAAVVDARWRLGSAQKQLAVVRAPLHPVRRTPLEVLGLIFEYCVDADFASPHYTTRQPFRLARVCSLWRRAAISHSRVWRNINIVFDRIQTNSSARWRKYAQNMLTRSGKSLLRIHVARQRNMLSLDRPIIKIVIAHLNRCESLVLSLGRICDDNDAALPFLLAELPVLRTLHLQVGTIQNLDVRTRILPHTPVLSSMTADFSFYGMTVKLPFLVDASLDRFDPEGLETFILAAPALLSLKINLHQIHRISYSKTLTHTGLQTLTVSNVRQETLTAFALCVQFPGLRKLVLQGENYLINARAEYFATVASMMPALEEVSIVLSLHGVDDASDFFFRGMSACPKLRRISFPNGYITAPFLRRICEFLGKPADGGMWSCPALTEMDLRLAGCGLATDCDLQHLVTLVEQRQLAGENNPHATSGPRPVKLTNVYLPPSAPASATAQLRSLLSCPLSMGLLRPHI